MDAVADEMIDELVCFFFHFSRLFSLAQLGLLCIFVWHGRQVAIHVVVSLVLEPLPSLWWMSVASSSQMWQMGQRSRKLVRSLLYSLFLALCFLLTLRKGVARDSPDFFTFFGRKQFIVGVGAFELLDGLMEHLCFTFVIGASQRFKALFKQSFAGHSCFGSARGGLDRGNLCRLQ